MRDTSVLQIDLTAIDHNMRLLQRVVGPDVGLCPVVKADAYGLGAWRVAKRLAASGAALFAVYTADQAAELIGTVGGVGVLILMPVWDFNRTDELYRALQAGRIHLAAHGIDHLEELASNGDRLGAYLPIHVEIDTGMSRGGASEEQIGEILATIERTHWLRLAGLFSHCADSEQDPELTEQQFARFHKVLAPHRALIPPGCLLHAANTAAVLRGGSFGLNLVRVGLGWAGYCLELKEPVEHAEAQSELRPAVSWFSRVVHIKSIPRRTPVGYGGTWRAPRKSRIGLVPVGYADGYPSQLHGQSKRPNRAMVGVHLNGSDDRIVFAPVIGAINMDQITIDLTELPEERIGIGTRIDLISSDPAAPNALPKVAALGGILPHELLSRLSPRMRRSYFVRPAEVQTTADRQLVTV